MLRFIGGLALLLIAYWTVLFVFQRRLAFPAPPIAGAPPRPTDAKQVWIQDQDVITEAWLLPPLTPATEPAPVLLFAHGNAELIDHWPEDFETPRLWGMAVLLVEYPGYGRSGGSPSQASIAGTFAAAYDWVANEHSLDRNRIVAYGRSLGGGAVGMLTRMRRPAALILESTFTSTRAFAPTMGAPGFLVRDPFDNIAAVRGFTNPVLVLHGAQDRTIPPGHGRALAAAAGTELHEMPCGHNDCPRPWPIIHDFLRRHRLL